MEGAECQFGRKSTLTPLGFRPPGTGAASGVASTGLPALLLHLLAGKPAVELASLGSAPVRFASLVAHGADPRLVRLVIFFLSAWKIKVLM
jgi:hypothetical protein